jgi:thiol:disulfide interchange protein
MTLSPAFLQHPPSRRITWRHRLQSAIVFIAACAIWTGANAQFTLKNQPQATEAGAVVQTEQVRAELVALAPDGVHAGDTVWVGLQLSHQPHWHTYWKNPGDSGLPTTLQWTLPTGITAGDIVWPTPKRIAVGTLANYGFEDTVLLPVPLIITKDFLSSPSALSGRLEIRLSAAWLVCRQECIPQEGNFVLRVPMQGSTALHAADFAAARAASPQPFSGSAQARVTGDALTLSVTGLPAAWQGKALNGFPETPNLLEAPTAPQSGDTVSASGTAQRAGAQSWNNGIWTAYLPLSAQRERSATALPMVLALDGQSLQTVAQVSGAWPPVATAAGVSPALQAALANNAKPPATQDAGWGTWLWALAAAVLGGLILNLMPCVLPVLAIKVLGFARHGDHSRASQRAQGLAYTLGVVLSFVGLGALMLALRATGEQLGWGFQLQSPAVVAVLAALFTLLGLNLAGLFDVGSLLPHRLASMQARHPVVDAFLSGVLAVAIASPCTAPFMGASLGYAISLPGAQALGIFAALGLGLALPFLAASWVPAVGQWLPKPGAWMDTFRRFMAFPMLATVVWLVWVLGHLSGVDGAGALLALLLGLALLVWSLGLEGRSRWVFAIISIAICAALAVAIGPNILKLEESTPNTASSADAANPAERATVWQAWTPGRVDAELAAGHPVFVDFTAAWCITCQYNKRATLGNPEVLADLRAHQVTLLRADWTRRDPAITRALEQLGRSGVPVYVLYQAGRAPVVFSEILNAQDLRTAVAQL